MYRVLVIDDDIELCELLTDYLNPEGFDVETVHDGTEGLKKALEGQHDLAVLDVMMPGMGGFDVLRNLREKSRLPVLMLTARGDDVDRIVGLEMGADDYLPKPFNPRELVARIRAIQRRTESTSASPTEAVDNGPLHIGDVKLDLRTRTALRNGDKIDLTSVEFNMLEVLLRQAGQVVPRETLAQQVLGRDLTPYDRSIDVHVSSLRKKLGHKAGSMERIKTIRGVGYQYALTETA